MLDKRLLACSDYIREGFKMCDVGTDHAYLPCYLVKNKLVLSAVAADINKKPLEAAKSNISKYNLDDKIQTVLSDGLKNIHKEDADDIVIAGMGGELIAKIILDCDWAFDKSKHFILQPMTNASFLRKTLYQNGFEILSETPVYENKHYYTVMLTAFCGEKKDISEEFSLLGKIPDQKGNEQKAYINYQIKRTLKIADGMSVSKSESEKATHYYELATKLKKYL